MRSGPYRGLTLAVGANVSAEARLPRNLVLFTLEIEDPLADLATQELEYEELQWSSNRERARRRYP